MDKVGVPVYVNNSIDTMDADFIGIDTYARHLDAAIKKSNTIGIIANYGTGKSSLIKYYEKNYMDEETKMVSINLWAVRNTSNDNLNTHGHFLHQLALKLHGEKYGKYINKRLNKNYGFISCDMHFEVYALLIIACILALIYYEVKILYPIEGIPSPNWIDYVLHPNNICCFILPPVILIILICAISMSNIVFSFSKNEAVRKINENDIVEIYKEIILKKRSHNKKIIVIEDLDRSTQPYEAYKFLKDLNRFYIDSLTDDIENVKFIVNIKPETFFEKMNNRINNSEKLYSKIFNYTLNLQPINTNNYDVILDNLLNEKKDELKVMGINVLPKENSKHIEGMQIIIYGRNLDIRDIKERLNYTIQNFHTLWEKAEGDKQKNSIRFICCAFVSYLQNEYPEYFFKYYKEDKFGQYISYYLKKNEDTNYDPKDLDLETEDNNEMIFRNKIKEAVENGILDMNYKMYFYNYPKDSYIRSTSETVVYNTIMNNLNMPEDFHIFLEDALLIDKNIIRDTYKERLRTSLGIPMVTFCNNTLFEFAIYNCEKDMFHFLEIKLSFASESINRSISFLRRLLTLEVDWDKIHSDFNEKICNLLIPKLEGVDNESLYDVRNTLIELLGRHLTMYKKLFISPLRPISKKEFVNIEDFDIALLIANGTDIDIEIIETINKKNTIIQTKRTETILSIFQSSIDRITDLRLAKVFADFSIKSKVITPEMYKYILNYVDIGGITTDDYIMVINAVEGLNVCDDVAETIKRLNIKKGISVVTSCNILQGINDYLFTYNILNTNLSMEQFEEYKSEILDNAAQIYNDNRELILYTRMKILEGGNTTDEYKSLFYTPYEIIRPEEIKKIDDIMRVLLLLDESQINNDNTDYIVNSIIRLGARTSSKAYAVLNFISQIPEDYLKSFFYGIDFEKIKYKNVSKKKRETFILKVENALNLIDNKVDIIHYMIKVKTLEPILERRLMTKLSEEESKEFKKLINDVEASDITQSTVEVIKNIGWYMDYSIDVQRKLFEYGAYDYYVYAKEHTDNKFTFEVDKLDKLEKSYISLFKNNKLRKAHLNSDFMRFACEKKLYVNASNEILKKFVNINQTTCLFEEVFKSDDNFVMEYLCEIKTFSDLNAEKKMLDLLYKRDNILISREVYKNLKKNITDVNNKKNYINKRKYRMSKLNK